MIHSHLRPHMCENCNRKPAFMGSSSWGHGYMCCGEVCGKRLGQRIRNGMYRDLHPLHGLIRTRTDDDARVYQMRNTIKLLKHKLKEHKRK